MLRAGKSIPEVQSMIDAWHHFSPCLFFAYSSHGSILNRSQEAREAALRGAEADADNENQEGGEENGEEESPEADPEVADRHENDGAGGVPTLDSQLDVD